MMQASRWTDEELKPKLDGRTKSSLRSVVFDMFEDRLHAATANSVVAGVLGTLSAARAGVAAIGKAMALSDDLIVKHSVKQFDRLLSNPRFDAWELFDPWVRWVVAERTEILVALDWTEFAKDGHSTIVAALCTDHGRATPLVWKTVETDKLAGARNDFEDEVIDRLYEILPRHVKVTLTADRAFGDTKLYDAIQECGWNFVIRFRGAIRVTIKGEKRTAAEWLSPSGAAKLYRNVLVTNSNVPLAGFVSVRAKAMKEAWFLATNLPDVTAAAVVALYGRRFTIEETFRDQKNPAIGFGISHVRISRTDRRDRLLFLVAVAFSLITLMGAASERAGYDRELRVNTVKTRTHSLLNQGWHWIRALPNMKASRAKPLLQAFDEILREQRQLKALFAVL